MQMSCFIYSPSLQGLNPPKRTIPVVPKAKLTQLQRFPSEVFQGKTTSAFHLLS